MDESLPQRTILQCRISDARDDDTTGTDDQEKLLRERAAALGWGVWRVVVENDTSAFKRRKVALPNGKHEMRVIRPGWRSIIEDLDTGRADGLLSIDLDRACRDPRDLEDLIDVVEARRVRVESLTGSLRLASDADITMARVMVAIANKSSRDTARRVSAARLRQATTGVYGGGSRAFGFEADGVTVRKVEADEIVSACKALLDDDKGRLTLIVADLNTRGVPTVRGNGPWTGTTLRDVLLRPRNAGLVVHRGEILEDVKAPWEPLVDRDTWEGVRALLTNPDRRTTPGPAPRWLGSGIYVCGHADHDGDAVRPTMLVRTAGGGQPAYRCRVRAHIVRTCDTIDAFVVAHLVARLSRPDAVDLLTPAAEPADAAADRRAAVGLRAKLAEARQLWEDGTDSATEYRVTKGKLSAKLAELEARAAGQPGRDPLAGIAGRVDAADVWATRDLGQRRAILSTLATVTCLPAGRGRGFKRESVDIDFGRRGA